jgi:hypothetical protein
MKEETKQKLRKIKTKIKIFLKKALESLKKAINDLNEKIKKKRAYLKARSDYRKKHYYPTIGDLLNKIHNCYKIHKDNWDETREIINEEFESLYSSEDELNSN